MVFLSDQASVPLSPPEIIDYRLPTSVIPIEYDVELQPNMYDGPADAFTFDGFVGIRMRVLQATNKITLHSNQLTLGSTRNLTATDTSQAPAILSEEIDTKRQFLIFHLDQDLNPGTEYLLQMNFKGSLKDDLAGLYLSQYQQGNATV